MYELLEVIIGQLKPLKILQLYLGIFWGIQIWFSARRCSPSGRIDATCTAGNASSYGRFGATGASWQLWDEGKDGKVRGMLFEHKMKNWGCFEDNLKFEIMINSNYIEREREREMFFSDFSSSWHLKLWIIFEYICICLIWSCHRFSPKRLVFEASWVLKTWVMDQSVGEPGYGHSLMRKLK